jgi:hypothetical protein
MWPALNWGDWRPTGLDHYSSSPSTTSSGGSTSWILLFPFILKLLKATLKASRLPCFRIISVMSAFIALSCFLGLCFTINKDFGYSMGDAFTLAGYVIAVGALICSFLFASHFRDCRCWKRLIRWKWKQELCLGPLMNAIRLLFNFLGSSTIQEVRDAGN